MAKRSRFYGGSKSGGSACRWYARVAYFMLGDDTLENVRMEELCEVLTDPELAVVVVTS